MRKSKDFLEQYNTPNYRIIDNDCVGGGYCYIYFSGNGIYDPDTLEVFRNKIILNDRYEWLRWKSKSSREIFIRDIYKEWYLRGISAKYNNIEKVYMLLKELSQGYKVVTVGSSAGGYAAVLFGCLLKAEKVFAFSAQFNLTDWLAKRNILNSSEVLEQNQYIDITSKIVNSHTQIYYFYPAYSDVDKIQSDFVVEIKNVHIFGIKSSLHGRALYPNCIPDLLAANDKKLEILKKNYVNKIVSPFKMALKISGLRKAVIGFMIGVAKPVLYQYKDWLRKNIKR